METIATYVMPESIDEKINSEAELLRRSDLTNSVLNEGAIERFIKMMEDKGPVFIDELLTKNGF